MLVQVRITCLKLQGGTICEVLQMLLNAVHVWLRAEQAVHDAPIPDCPAVPVYLLLPFL